MNIARQIEDACYQAQVLGDRAKQAEITAQNHWNRLTREQQLAFLESFGPPIKVEHPVFGGVRFKVKP